MQKRVNLGRRALYLGSSAVDPATFRSCRCGSVDRIKDPEGFADGGVAIVWITTTYISTRHAGGDPLARHGCEGLLTDDGSGFSWRRGFVFYTEVCTWGVLLVGLIYTIWNMS